MGEMPLAFWEVELADPDLGGDMSLDGHPCGESSVGHSTGVG